MHMINRKPTKLTAMHHQHLGLGAVMMEHAGWQRPAHYTSLEEELKVVRLAAGIGDVSPLGKILVQGDNSDRRLGTVLTGMSSLDVNKSGTASLMVSGSETHRIIVSRLSEDELYVTCAPGTTTYLSEAINAQLASSSHGCVHLVDMTSNHAAVNVIGPLAIELLAKLTDLDIVASSFTDLTCAQGQLAEVYSMIMRCDQSGLPSYNLYFAREYGHYLWDVLLEAGSEFGIVPIGVEALQQLAVEG